MQYGMFSFASVVTFSFQHRQLIFSGAKSTRQSCFRHSCAVALLLLVADGLGEGLLAALSSDLFGRQPGPSARCV